MSPSEALLDLFDRMSCGALLLDKGEVVGLNDTVQAQLQELCRAYGETTGDDSWPRDLLRQLEQNTAYRRGLPVPARPIGRCGGRPLVAYTWSFPWSEDDSPKPVLILIDLERPTDPGEASLRHLFGLTGAEAKLAARLASGRSLEEVASELRITVGTARSQLRSIFAKTHTHRQAELVALLNRAWLLRVEGRPLALSNLGGLLRIQVRASSLDKTGVKTMRG